MSTLGKLFVEMLLSAGINADDESLNQIVTSEIDVPDDIAKSLKSNLMTVDSAKHNPDLKKYFVAQALNAVDTELANIIESNDFDDVAKSNFKSEKSSYKRMKLVADALASKANNATVGNVPDDKLNAYKSEIEKLNSQLSQIKDEHESKLKSVRDESEQNILNFALNAELNGKQYANESLDKNVNRMIARQLLDDSLKSDGAKIIRTDAGLKLVRSDDSEMDFMVENKNVKFGDYVDNLLTGAKLLKVNESVDAGNGQTSVNQTRHISTSNDLSSNSGNIIADYDRQLAELNGTN